MINLLLFSIQLIFLIRTYYYPCPCGDRFAITREELEAGEEVATCPSCSLIVKVIYNPEDFEPTEETSHTVATPQKIEN